MSASPIDCLFTLKYFQENLLFLIVIMDCKNDGYTNQGRRAIKSSNTKYIKYGFWNTPETCSASSQFFDSKYRNVLTDKSRDVRTSLPFKKHSLASNKSSQAPRSPLVSMPPSKTKPPNGIHWLSPTSMAASMLAGIASALCHHSYYEWLSEQEVGSVTKQQWAVGKAV